MKKLWHDEGWEDYTYWQGQDKKTLRKINSLLKSIERNGYYSVHIDGKNRIVFKIENNILEILQCGSHYRDH